jgi:hypothetical protein
MALAAPGHASCAEVRDIATAHLADVRTKPIGREAGQAIALI